ncbi:MAG: hypothetical protein HXY25_02615 [Alphaproteobacteria bacterium]|nr:hypothetical protein [Alphaproteobacteria bacterium]
MSGAKCPKCNGTGSVSSQIHGYDPNKVNAGMGMHRCDRCAGQGVIHVGLGMGTTGSDVASGDGSLGDRVGNIVIWVFAIFFGLTLANAPIFGLNWAVSGFIGLIVGAAVAGLLLAFRIGRYILWGLGAAFVIAVIVALSLEG